MVALRSGMFWNIQNFTWPFILGNLVKVLMLVLRRFTDLNAFVLVVEVTVFSSVVKACCCWIDYCCISCSWGVVCFTNWLGKLQRWDGILQVFILHFLFCHAKHVAPLIVAPVEDRWESWWLLHCVKLVFQLRLQVYSSVSRETTVDVILCLLTKE